MQIALVSLPKTAVFGRILAMCVTFSGISAFQPVKANSPFPHGKHCQTWRFFPSSGTWKVGGPFGIGSFFGAAQLARWFLILKNHSKQTHVPILGASNQSGLFPLKLSLTLWSGGTAQQCVAPNHFPESPQFYSAAIQPEDPRCSAGNALLWPECWSSIGGIPWSRVQGQALPLFS